MFAKGKRRSVVLVVAVAGAAFVLGRISSRTWELPAADAAPPPAAQGGDKDAHAADRAAILAGVKSFVEAFEGGDAKAVASHWTEEGEYIADDGSVVRGRDAIQKAYAGLFDKNKSFKVEIDMESLRFTGKNTAIEEGYMKVTRGKAELPLENKYSVLHVREGDQWLMALVREWPSDGHTLRELQWLIGDWKAERDGMEVSTNYKWNETKTFIHAHFTIQTKERTLTGFQIIGKDPATGLLRSWTFEQDGGFGEAVWTRDGRKWEQETAGVLKSGATASATNILTRIDDDSFTWQSIGRTLDGIEIGDAAPIRVTRVGKQK
jgi:uncharacterized protein (TIGR02246 family)